MLHELKDFTADIAVLPVITEFPYPTVIPQHFTFNAVNTAVSAVFTEFPITVTL